MKPLQDMTFPEAFQTVVKRFPQKPVLSFIDGVSLTYTDVAEHVAEISHFMEQQSINKGDRIALLSENSPHWGVAFFAIVNMGAVAVPILPEFHQTEIKHILQHSGTRGIFVSRKLYSKLEWIDVETLDFVILLDDFSVVPGHGQTDTLRQLIRNGSHEIEKMKDFALKVTGLKPQRIDQEDLASIIYTSGTTGHSKGVMLTHRNLIFDAVMTGNFQPIGPNDRLLSILPLAHTYEFTLGFVLPFLVGSHVFYLDKAPTPRILNQALQQVKPTMMLSVPLVIEKVFRTRVQKVFQKSRFRRMLYSVLPIRKFLHRIAGKKLYEAFGGRLHFFGIGGALLAPETEQFLRDAKFPYAIGYGLTETSPLCIGALPGWVRFQSTGVAIPGVKIRISQPDPTTGEGEVQIKGDNVMRGYYKDEERTRKVFTADGWFKTGDLGVIKRGHLYFRGRSKNVIIGSNGKNVYPEELESMINAYEEVSESLVFARDGKIFARVHFDYDALELLYGKHHSETTMEKRITGLLQKIHQEVNARLASFARIHEFIEQRESFEKTPTQKIKRYLYN